MLAAMLALAGVLLVAGAAGTEVLALRAGDGQAQREAQMADLAEEFAATAAAVLQQVEARTGALEALVRQVLAAQPAAVRAAAARAPRPAVVSPAAAPARAVPASVGSPVVRQVTRLAGEGRSAPEIARQLNLSRSVVDVALRLGAQAAEEAP